MFKEIYNMIVEDNIKHDLKPFLVGSTSRMSQQPKDQHRQPMETSPRPLSVPDRPTPGLGEADRLTLAPPPRYMSPQLSTGTRTLVQDEQRLHENPVTTKQRPLIHPKPEGLQDRLKASSSNANPALGNVEERFSQLRVQQKPFVTRAEVEPRRSLNDGRVEMPSPTQYTPSSSNASPSQSYQTLSMQGGLPVPYGKPGGPREMPPPLYPPPPPKIPLNARPEVSLPRAPSPAYNPARMNPASSNAQAHLDRKRSSIGTDFGSRPSSSGIEESQQYSKLNIPSRNPNSNTVSGGTNLANSAYRDLPYATSIKAEELYDQLRAYNVLVIDVRSRQEYDQGHIFAKSVMCIEPLELRSGVSAEELEERLVISPPVELALFERRNEFDLVIYYDQHTSSSGFLTGAPNISGAPSLRALHDTLYEFNAYKPLQRPPAVLLGGLDAWVELVGHQALQVSRTAAAAGPTRSRIVTPKPGRPIGRVPMASSNSSLEVRKRRLREYYPLDADEEKTWRERARKEEVEASEYQETQSDNEAESAQSYPQEINSPLVHSYEEFLRKFPEPSTTRQSMVMSSPARPAKVPSSLPNVPSRPPPAVPRPSYGGVSDSSPLSPVSRQSMSAQPPLYTPRAISHYLKLPRTGLINFSVTCYMNATIQCLVATIPLSQFFLDNRWRDYTQKNWKGSNGIMPEIYANLVRNLWKSDVQAVRPTSLRNFCARLNREWGVDRQQDAKEYLDFLLDCLHEDLNINWQRNPLTPLSSKDELVREGLPVRYVSRIEWKRYSHRESSFISSLFAGQHASRLRCTTCKHTSTTYEAFYSISVEIPRAGRGDIHDCLRSYCQEEMLSGDEVWKCPYCKCEREATKQIIITRAPQFLVVHFKRFSASKTESARKIHTPIHFPLHGLNIEPYMVSTQSAGINSQDPAIEDDAIDAAITPPYLYDAYAVMRHLGQSGSGGHYISLIRDQARACWHKFDDERVTDFDPNKLKPENRLQNEQAYLVFYGRAVAR